MTDYYIASDYAGLKAGNLEFYYGYEETVSGPLHTVDQEQEWEWCFVARKNGTEIMRLPVSELTTKDKWDCGVCLLAGIAKYLETLPSDNGIEGQKGTLS